MTKHGVMRKSKMATEERDEITMLSEVAKPFMMLSEYLITTAVTRPPKTCMATVAHAQPPKFSNNLQNQLGPLAVEPGMAKIGTRAGRREKSES